MPTCVRSSEPHEERRRPAPIAILEVAVPTDPPALAAVVTRTAPFSDPSVGPTKQELRSCVNDLARGAHRPFMSPSSWRSLREDRDGAYELIDAASATARAEGRTEDAERASSDRRKVEDTGVQGGLLRGPDGRPWGFAVWTPVGGNGRRVAPVYLGPEHHTPAGWTTFLSALLETSDPGGPVLLFETALHGFPEPEAVAFLGPRGFRPYHRFGLAFPPGGPLPAPPNRPLDHGRLRTVGPADLEPLVALTAECYANSVDRFLFGEEAKALPAARSLLRALFEGQYGSFVPDASFGLELDGKLMGVTLVTRRPTHKLLADVEVHPGVQRQGHARRLIRASLEALAADTETPLVLAVTQENPGALRLYQDLGFVIRQGPFTFWADPTALGLSSLTAPAEVTPDPPSAANVRHGR
jgi:GNAT superfamily N-acetyltransferase